MGRVLDLASYIDQSMLSSNVTSQDLEQLCANARKYRFSVVMVNPSNVRSAKEHLKSSRVRVGSVVGFPLGASTTEVKVFEAEEAENAGAEDIDMVINIGAVKSGDFRVVEREVHAVRSALSGRTVLKVIIECPMLNETEKISCARICADSGANYVKTSTGFFGSALTTDVELLFRTVGSHIGIKAAGGIRDLKSALSMIESGASRIGTSAGVSIIEEYLRAASR